jgi:hypothetical protein
VTGACHLWLSRLGFHNATNVGGGWFSFLRQSRIPALSSHQTIDRALSRSSGDGYYARNQNEFFRSLLKVYQTISQTWLTAKGRLPGHLPCENITNCKKAPQRCITPLRSNEMRALFFGWNC